MIIQKKRLSIQHLYNTPPLLQQGKFSGRGESEYVKTSNAKFEQLRGYTQGASRPSERFEPRQTTVCRLNPHVPNRKLKPPQMRRVEFSGRGERIRTFDILLPKQALYQTELRPETKAIITAFYINANIYVYFMLV